MAYAPGSLRLVAGQTWEPDVPRIWVYRSTDAMATVRAVNYFTDARAKQMQVGDIVYVHQMTGAAITAVTISVVIAVASTGADLSDGTAITVTNT